jgi:hypothetical protein
LRSQTQPVALHCPCIAGLGVVSTVMGVAFIWQVRSSGKKDGKDEGAASKDDEPVIAAANA